ncbi:sulfotransferase domain-containing protein [Flagellimonas eckloniae]|uniref:Sulfotransferase domain-containing protein n=1 Tax=Flagellimonas eckloniae TaxID=346185 RepID=A0A0Q1BXE4_9FLAO|nr:sulfotransferase domain-containing protein [Allomuricauda eckloniae]KQC29335.1 hypothetical protein AAY42_05015 [Allomuricauda eckloniae]
MKLDFVIIGGQKCGSTYIQNVIDNHPEINMVEKESPHFEDPDYANNGLARLKKKLDNLDQSKILGIKRPNYLGKPEVADRIHQLNPKMKLIAILRNPLDRFKSAYFHQMSYGVGPVLPLNTGALRLLNGDLKEQYPRTSEVLDFGLYSKHLEKYTSMFGENLLTLTFDELKHDNLAVIKKCYHFLGVDDSYIPHQILDKRPMKVNYSLQSARFLTLRNRFRFDYNKDKTRIYQKKKTFGDRLCIKSIEFFNDLVFIKILKQKKKPKFTNEIRERLIRWYLQDIELLEQIINKDLSAWKS